MTANSTGLYLSSNLHHHDSNAIGLIFSSLPIVYFSKTFASCLLMPYPLSASSFTISMRTSQDFLFFFRCKTFILNDYSEQHLREQVLYGKIFEQHEELGGLHFAQDLSLYT